MGTANFRLDQQFMQIVQPSEREPKVRNSPRFGIVRDQKQVSFPSIIVYTSFSKAIILLQETELWRREDNEKCLRKGI